MRNLFQLARPCSVAVLIALAAGCTVVPEPLTEDDHRRAGEARLIAATADLQPAPGELSLYDAMARALKYNLDVRVEVMETALQMRALDAASASILPQLVASSGYRGRSNSDSSVASTQDTDVVSADLQLSWNVLDFGLSYVRAKQTADRVLIHQELKRKVVNQLIEDVRSTYWRAASFERLVKKMRRLETRISRALRDVRARSADRQDSPLIALTIERDLLETQRQLFLLEGDLMTAKSQLAALMNLAPGVRFTLADEPPRQLAAQPPDYGMSEGELFRLAAANRPEMREISYQMRVNEQELDAAFLRLLPNFNVFAGANYDSNEFIAETEWVSWGATVSWNLLNVFSLPKQKALITAQGQALEARALSIAMAVMTQVHVSRARYAHLAKSHEAAAALASVSGRIVRQIRSEASIGLATDQDVIQEEMRALLDEARRDLAHAETQSALANYYASLGFDPYPAELDLSAGLDEVAAALASKWRAYETPAKGS